MHFSQSCLTYNFGVKKLLRFESNISTNYTALRFLGFADDLNVVGETLEDMGNVVRLLDIEPIGR